MRTVFCARQLALGALLLATSCARSGLEPFDSTSTNGGSASTGGRGADPSRPDAGRPNAGSTGVCPPCADCDFTTEIIAESAIGPSLTVDTRDRVHVVYDVQPGSGALDYVRREGGVWSAPEPVDDFTAWESVIVGEDGTVYVPFIDFLRYDFYVASRTPSGQWSIAHVGPEGRVGWGPSAALDAAGRLHVTFGVFSTGLMHGVESSGAWEIERVAPSDGRKTRLEIDGGGLHVAYYLPGETPAYAHRIETGTWEFTSFDPPDPSHSALEVDLALSRQGAVHAIYTRYVDEGHGETWHAFKPALGEFSYEKLDAPKTSWIKIAAGEGDAWHALYSHDCCDVEDADTVRYAYFDGATTFTVPVEPGLEGHPGDIAIDSRGGVHAVIWGTASREIVYAYLAPRCSD